VLTLHTGEQRAGNDLKLLVDHARHCRKLLDSVSQKYDRSVVEQTAIAGALNPDVLSDPERAIEAASYVANRLDMLGADIERGWEGKPTDDGGLSFTRVLRGITQTHEIDGKLIRSAEARKLDEQATELQDVYLKKALLQRKDDEFEVRSPTQLLDTVFGIGRKGLSIQRYKGLGEMNPEQLWETTLDPNVRTLLQVKVAHADEADEMFSTLMGDVVEPRREFIQDNALNVANLDI